MIVNTEAIEDVALACEQYRAHMIDLDVLKERMWQAALALTAFEDRQFRDLLQQAEGKLDMIQYTVDDEDVYAESLQILTQVEETIQKVLLQD